MLSCVFQEKWREDPLLPERDLKKLIHFPGISVQVVWEFVVRRVVSQGHGVEDPLKKKKKNSVFFLSPLAELCA